MAKPGGLGRGLGALLKDVTPEPGDPDAPQVPGGLRELPLSSLRAGAFQPRREFDETALAELAQSIRERGVVQPLLVRPQGKSFEVIAGERRMRAAKLAKLKTVPALVLELDDQAALELALIENLQREDLNPVEEAEGYHRLAAEFSLTQAQIAERVGKGRPTVANALRLLELPAAVLGRVATGDLSPGHAKVLLRIDDPDHCERMARRCLREQWSVRALETVLQSAGKPRRKKKRPAPSDVPDDHLQKLTETLYHHFGTPVRLRPSRTFANGKKAKGSLEIDFFSNEELDRLLSIIGLTEDL